MRRYVSAQANAVLIHWLKLTLRNGNLLAGVLSCFFIFNISVQASLREGLGPNLSALPVVVDVPFLLSKTRSVVKHPQPGSVAYASKQARKLTHKGLHKRTTTASLQHTDSVSAIAKVSTHAENERATTSLTRNSENSKLVQLPVETSGKAVHAFYAGASEWPQTKPLTPSLTTFPAAENADSLADPEQLQKSKALSKQQVDLIKGKAEVITTRKPIKRVSITDPTVASAVVISGRQVQLIGNASGVASLMIWQQDEGNRYLQYDLSVRRDVSLLEKQIAQIAPRVTVTPLVAQDTVILRGEVDTLEEAQLALQLAKAFFSTNASGSSGSSSGSSGGGSSSSQNTVASNVPGSALLGNDSSVINLIHVKGMPSTRLELVRQKLQQVHPNIRLDVVAGLNGTEKAILTGKVPTTGYIAKAINMASLFYGQPGLKVINGPGGNQVRADAGDKDFHTAEAFSDNMDINLLQGIVVTDSSGNVVSLMEVAQKPQVRCRVKILDVSRSAVDVLGVPFVSYLGGTLQLGADLTPPGAPGATGSALRNLRGVTSAVVGSNSLNITLQALQEKQMVRSLAEPTLLMLSGEKASFLAGGEIPIPISDANGRITLEYKEFGIRLNVIATVTDDQKIHLQVAPEVSSIDPSLAFESSVISIPGIRSRRVQTTVEMLPGQNFVLGGLFNSEDTQSFSQLPILGNLPIIGNFFRNNLKDKAAAEMVVLIQPEIITAEELADPKP